MALISSKAPSRGGSISHLSNFPKSIKLASVILNKSATPKFTLLILFKLALSLARSTKLAKPSKPNTDAPLRAIGKVKLLDLADGPSNRYVPFEEYLKKDVQRACDLANTFGCKLIRGFSFYHPRGTDPDKHLSQAIDQLGRIARLCDSHGLTFGLEVEANLIGQTGKLLKKLYDGVSDPAMLLIFDGANLVCQGMSTEQVFEEYLAMKDGMGWLHVKDYQRPTTRSSHVDEESLKNFVPADLGDSGHEAIFRDVKRDYAELLTKLAKRGIPGLFLDLEPHVKGGGQFGGFSGPDGFGVALRGLCRLLDYVGLNYDLRTFADIRKSVATASTAKAGA